MTVYVTVETFQGVFDNVRAYVTELSALNAEQNWPGRWAPQAQNLIKANRTAARVSQS